MLPVWLPGGMLIGLLAAAAAAVPQFSGTTFVTAPSIVVVGAVV
jgi:hypothetical protein